MKILLLNDNPVVNKLVTLSAQKTSDDLEIATTLDEINMLSCDLLVIDDTLYSDEFMQELKEKVEFKKSLYICSKDSEIIDGFTSILKKPFLPTDLVDIFSQLSKDVNLDSSTESSESTEVYELEELNNQELPDSELNEKELNIDEKSDEVESFEEASLSDETTKLDEPEISEEFKNEELSLDELDSEELSIEDLENDEILLDEEDLENIDELNLEDELELNDLNLENDDIVDSILDKDDLQEVQDLLKATSESSSEFSEDAEPIEEILIQPSEDSEVDKLEEISLESELEVEDVEESLSEFEELNMQEEDSQEPNLQNIEEQIESAEEELTQEDLESEVELNDFDSLTTNDIKLAIGETVTEDNLKDNEGLNKSTKVDDINSDLELTQESLLNTKITSDNDDGIEKLKRLLEALSNEEVVASMKGMKINISINIDLGS